MSKKVWSSVCVQVVILCCGWGVAASEPLVGTERVAGARSLSLGNAIRASSANGESVYFNPATMSMANVYHINLKYAYTGRDALHSGGVAFVDSITSARIAAGLSLDYVRDNADASDFESWDARLALSTGIGESFFFGITGRYLRAALDVDPNSEGPNGAHVLDRSGIHAGGFTFDAGGAVRIGDNVNVGVVGYNLSNTGSVYAPLSLGTGVSVTIERVFNIETNMLMDFTSYDDTAMELSLGTELLLAEKFGVRAGYMRDFHFSINTVSAGLGWTSRQFAVDVGYAQDIEYPSRVRIALGIRLFIG